jgi:hypothetical protein
VHHIRFSPARTLSTSGADREAKKASAAFAFACGQATTTHAFSLHGHCTDSGSFLVHFALSFIYSKIQGEPPALFCARQQKKIEVVRRNIRLLLHVTLRGKEANNTTIYVC